MLPRLSALALLSECTGDDIWSVEHCRQRRVPEAWIGELVDAFESGFRTDRETIYHDEKVVAQYRGVRDVDLAVKLGETLGVDVEAARRQAISRRALVRAIKDAVYEG